MRIDKFLKVSRMIKRRTVAKNVADAQRIFINGLLAKPSKEVKIGDLIELHLGLKVITIKVVSLTQLKDQDMYELISEEKRSL
ncbi:RNA-binding S4 domain-containing protein [Acholeplasma granularum]|uniref:RNA-binding S4 domain-containing protein n=1 Tax=Acholeplasma granularum TaxID=264635 RepID=UPI0004B9709B|nr:RNA-binding S4 domain-containing protein [Acholeplasma granularum]